MGWEGNGVDGCGKESPTLAFIPPSYLSVLPVLVSTGGVGRYRTKYIAPSLMQLYSEWQECQVVRQEQAVGIASAAITKSRQKVGTNPTVTVHTIISPPQLSNTANDPV